MSGGGGSAMVGGGLGASLSQGVASLFGAAARLSRAVFEAVQVAAPMSEEDLREAMEAVATDVQPWGSQEIELIAPLQEAARNMGRVDHMVDAARNDLALAVKRMPTSWVRKSPEDFAAAHPMSGERPWHDLGYLRYLNEIDFPYVCKLYGVFRDDVETFVATSLCPEGDLFSWFDNPSVPPSGRDREVYMQPIVVQLLSATRWLHNLGIAHRDLSLENVLLARDWRGRPLLRICDFGMATLSRRALREIRGKLPYQAPEMHLDAEYDTFVADNFALGVTLFAMAAEDYPWTCTRASECQLFQYVSTFGLRRFLEKRTLRKGNGERLIEVFSLSFTELVEALMKVVPSERASLGELGLVDDAAEASAATRAARHGKGRTRVWDLAWLRGSWDMGLVI